MTFLVKVEKKLVADLLVDLGSPTGAGSREEVDIDVIGIEDLFLPLMVLGDEIVDVPFEGAGVSQLFVGFDDGRSEPIGAGYENDVIAPYSIPKKPGEDICINEHTANMAEVELLIAVRHPGGNDGPLGKGWTVVRVWYDWIFLCCHMIFFVLKQLEFDNASFGPKNKLENEHF